VATSASAPDGVRLISDIIASYFRPRATRQILADRRFFLRGCGNRGGGAPSSSGTPVSSGNPVSPLMNKSSLIGIDGSP
jgi:hypothetical protein